MRRRVLLKADKPYLTVEPTEVQWITVDVPITYAVRTNPKREWRVS